MTIFFFVARGCMRIFFLGIPLVSRCVWSPYFLGFCFPLFGDWLGRGVGGSTVINYGVPCSANFLLCSCLLLLSHLYVCLYGSGGRTVDFLWLLYRVNGFWGTCGRTLKPWRVLYTKAWWAAEMWRVGSINPACLRIAESRLGVGVDVAVAVRPLDGCGCASSNDMKYA